MKDSNKNDELDIIASIGSIVITMFIVFGVMIVFASIMRPFGFYGESLFSIILFFTFALFLAFPLQEVGVFLSNFLMYYKKLPRKWAKRVFIFFSIIANTVSLYSVNYYMQSVTASNLSIFVVSVTVAFLSVK